MSLGDYFDPSDEADEGSDHVATPNQEQADVDGIKNERNVIIYGNISSGEWEAVLMECHKDVKVWQVDAGPQASLETVQLQEQAVADTLNLLAEATKVYVLPEEQTGSTAYVELATQAMANAEDAVVVLSPTAKDHSRLKLKLTDSGAVVVASLEDAALYIACAM